MKTKMYKLAVVVMMMIVCKGVFAQDAHFSQYDASPIYFNPALTGIFQGSDYRVVSQYRGQWGTISNRYASTTMSIEMPYQKKWGVGTMIINDDAAKVFSTFGFQMAGAYLITSPFDKKMRLSVGAQLGLLYKYTGKNNLVFNNQYSEGAFDSDLPNGEALDRRGKLMPDVGFGVSYVQIDQSAKVNPYAGISVFHITMPNEAFIGDKKSRLPMKFNFYGGSRIQITNKIMIDPSFLVAKQTNLYDISGGIKSKFEMNMYFDLLAGFYYRHKDAVYLLVGANYKNTSLQISYDFTISDLRKYTKYQGGLEISVIFQQFTRRQSRVF